MTAPCCHLYAAPSVDAAEGTRESLEDSVGDGAFAVDTSRIVFGRESLHELGAHARALGMSRVALFTDRRVRSLPSVAVAEAALRKAGIDCVIYDEVRVEPTDRTMLAGATFFREGSFDGLISVGGGSVIDSAKAAALYATYPADFMTYVNPPLGAGQAVPGRLPPHIACPTTSGTGSECTGIAICTLTGDPLRKRKTGLVSRALRPTLAIIDPTTTYTLPGSVVAASGCDVLCHALESYTARPYNRRPRPKSPELRPMSQGANPFSDLGSLESLRLCGRYLLRAVGSADDREARDHMMYAATLAGIAFGNAGVHLPHGMAYAVAAAPPVAGFAMPDYEPTGAALLPHGVSVMLSAPAAFRFTASACLDRHLRAAEALGADIRGVGLDDAGSLVADQLITLLRKCALPSGLRAVGLAEGDLDSLCADTEVQARLLGNSPRPVDRPALRAVFADAMTYFRTER